MKESGFAALIIASARSSARFACTSVTVIDLIWRLRRGSGFAAEAATDADEAALAADDAAAAAGLRLVSPDGLVACLTPATAGGLRMPDVAVCVDAAAAAGLIACLTAPAAGALRTLDAAPSVGARALACPLAAVDEEALLPEADTRVVEVDAAGAAEATFLTGTAPLAGADEDCVGALAGAAEEARALIVCWSAWRIE